MKSVGCTDLKESAILISGGSSVTVVPNGIPSEEEVILRVFSLVPAILTIRLLSVVHGSVFSVLVRRPLTVS